jgi:hypothetical protein
MQFPTSADYWNKSYYKTEVAPNAIIRNWCKLLLHIWHFFSNEEYPPNGRLHEIQPSVDKSKFQGVVSPGKTLY